MTLTAQDSQPPTAVCNESINVAIPSLGIGRVFAQSFDEGSSDNCAPAVYLKVRRVDIGACGGQGGDVSQSIIGFQEWFDDDIYVCCDDVNAGPVLVQLTRQVVKQKRIIRSDINTADTLQLQDVYGIGPTLARRIVTFRDRLGGFVSMDQLREVYGLDSVVVERVKKQFSILLHFEPRKLDLNTARIEDFLRHPYINRRQAQAIVAYRSQHSRIDSTGQLRNIPTIDTTWTRKMKPYLFVLPLAERR